MSKIIEMSNKVNEEMKGLNEKCENQTKHHKKGIPFKSKSFSFKDIYYLLMRSVQTEYICEWKTLSFLFFIYSMIPIILINIFNPKISEPNGCIDSNSTHSSCEQQLEDDTLLIQSYKFYYLSSLLPMLIKLTITTISFHSELKLFSSEHRNSKSLQFYFFFAYSLNAIIL